MTIEQTIDQMEIAGSAASRSYRKFTGEMRVRSSGKGRHFLVTNVKPFDFAVAADGIGYSIQAVADNAIDTLDARGREGFDELICNGLHICAPKDLLYLAM
jgi:hypothetical protein